MTSTQSGGPGPWSATPHGQPHPARRAGALMTKVAHVYREQGIRQADIEATLHIFEAKVSRLLKRAAETGIVGTIVVVTQGADTDLEEALERRFGLLDAVVVDVEGDEPEILAGLGSAGAAYLENTLPRRAPRHLLLEPDPARRRGRLRRSGFRAPRPWSTVGGMGVPAVEAEADDPRRAGGAGRGRPAVRSGAPAGGRQIAENLLDDPAMAEWLSSGGTNHGLGRHWEPGAVGAAAAERQRRGPGRPAGCCLPRAPWATSDRSSPRTASWWPARSTRGSSASPWTGTGRFPAGSACRWVAQAPGHLAAISGGWVNVMRPIWPPPRSLSDSRSNAP